jgi:hypothetical protein
MSGMAMTCLYLAIIDQYFTTSSRPCWQHWCNIKLAHRLTRIPLIICTLHAIPYFVLYNHIISSWSNQTSCQITNDEFIEYHTYGYILILNTHFSLITAVFGLMAYHNARYGSHTKSDQFVHESPILYSKYLCVNDKE